ncbi:hypothetical protein NA57DRAFT_32125 [Rhizodiscina lignyota]|uniref:SPRY domain-containing protein n=1 Tax=Rhizodiscina lignyota TaxID=1504668 RepID=A0A9P4IL04_9PEZI|nr:hypothetical protein NA57DRAFT_32125 [Rhizodiscina lignyota]
MAEVTPKPAPVREQREKKESLKKREAAGHVGRTPDTAKVPAAPSPMRYNIGPPKHSDFEPPRDPLFVSHEPIPFLTPDGQTELKRPIDHAENKRSYRYTHCVADPLFRHKQYYRQSDAKPFGPRMSFEDGDRWMHYDDSGTMVSIEKGWRMGRGNVVAREGRLYYEVKIINGVPAEGDAVPPGSQGQPQPHIRMGWARREAPLDAPVGFDGYSYGITDIRFDTMHKSRPGKIAPPKAKGKALKSKASQPKTGQSPVDHVRTGDVIGMEITLPSLSLHRKVVDGNYNPAVDFGDGFDPVPIVPGVAPDPAQDIIRDRIPVPYKGNVYFEQQDYIATKDMELYADRSPQASTALAALSMAASKGSGSGTTAHAPNPNHPQPALRTLPNSSIKIYKNGQLVGTAFESLMSFLPPASAPNAAAGARPGFDDGMVGYFPAVSAFSNGIAQVNFGPHWWCPPEELKDVEMSGTPKDGPEGRKLRGVGERYKEQIAEDVLWDLVDEADFFAQDGGYEYQGEGRDVPGMEKGKGTVGTVARGMDGADY